MDIEMMYVTYRPLLFSIAYRMLGRVVDAEDMVQETFVAAQKNGDELSGGRIANMKAYLCKMVTNRCIDYLKSARKQRELYVGPWLPEPLVQQYAGDSGNDPLQATLMEETLSYAFLVMLQQLTPVERAVFILREAFDYSYRDIADMLGKTELGCRKIYSRIKRKVQAERPAALPKIEESEALVKKFMYASATGNLQMLIDMLAEDVVLYSDGGGKVLAAIRPLTTREHVIGFLTGLAAKADAQTAARTALINGQIGLVITGGDPYPTVVCFQMDGDRFRRIYMVRNPDKLKHLEDGALSPSV